jgi:Co/Zn/Cd efflux system component
LLLKRFQVADTLVDEHDVPVKQFVHLTARSRNDALGNLAVMLAALGVFGTGNAWPALLAAAVMGALALSGSWSVLRQARVELQESLPAKQVAFVKFERR